MSRRKGREMAMMMLFQTDLGDGSQSEVEELFWRCHPASESTRGFATELFRYALQGRDRIQELLRRHVHHWRLERISGVDRSILQMALAELLFMGTPQAVVIDEAVEIARKYGSEKSPEFVNGVLDAALREVGRDSA